MKFFVLFLLLVLPLQIPYAGTAPSPGQISIKKKKQEEKPKKAPKAPEYQAAFGNFLIGLGMLIAAISKVNPWITIGIGIGIILITLILVALIDPKKLVPKGKGIVGKIIAIILGFIIGLLLVMLLIMALVVGLAFLVAGIIGTTTVNPALGGLAIACMGLLYLLIHTIVYWIRRARYRKYERAEQSQGQ